MLSKKRILFSFSYRISTWVYARSKRRMYLSKPNIKINPKPRFIREVYPLGFSEILERLTLYLTKKTSSSKHK